MSVARVVKKEAKWTTVDAEQIAAQNRRMHGELGALLIQAMDDGPTGDTSEAADLEKVFNSHGYKVEDVVRREFVAAVRRTPGLSITEAAPARAPKRSGMDRDGDLPLYDDSTPVQRVTDRTPPVGRFGDAQFRLTIKAYGMHPAEYKMRPFVQVRAELVDGRGQLLARAEGASNEKTVPAEFAQNYYNRPALFADHLAVASRTAAEEILRKLLGKR